jgi:putative nucleotidyltransferase with HDIG domain
MGTLVATRLKAANPEEIILAIESLPAFPTVALRAMNMLAGTDTALGELCDLVRCDPVFTAEILRIANSPLVAFSKEITSVLQASMLLGFRRLRRVVITVGLSSYMDTSTPATKACWRHSAACAIVAERTARWNAVDRDFVYTAGILHDIGRVALSTVSPQVYSDLYERAASEPVWDPLQREQEAFGIDHCAAGRLLIQSWNLPQPFIDTTCSHHAPLTNQEDAAEVMRLSCLLADSLGFAAFWHPSIPGGEEVLSMFPESVCKHLPNKNDLAAEIAKEVTVIESA